MDRPVVLPDVLLNYVDLVVATEQYLAFLEEEYNEDGLSDYRNAIFEAAMEMLYGKEVWKFVREKQSNG